MPVNANIIQPDQIKLRLEDILPHVEKPSRYFAGELGIVRKPWDSVRARMLIAFPDVYEIAAGNLGHKLIRHIINGNPDFLAERVYAPWPDMEQQLRDTGTPLYALESYRPVSDFDILGFSLTHELSFSNLLLILDLGGLGLKSSERGFPIVAAGGPAVFNPEPMAAFVDAFLLGDGELASLEMVNVIAEYREEIDNARGDFDAEVALKKRILDTWGGAGEHEGIRGIYVPDHFEVEQDSDGRINSIKNIAGGPDSVEKALLIDLNDAPWETSPPVPHMQGVSNRITVEPARGCTRGCRFCQAGMIYRPYRMRSTDLLVDQAEQLLKSTGYTEQSFLALSATDWPGLEEFIDRIQAPKRDFHLKISLPSGRISGLNENITRKLTSNRKGGLTLAIEAATSRLRKVINKALEDEDIDRAIEVVLSTGWDLVKLYFMVGLPTETDEDVGEIVDLIDRIRSIVKRMKREGKTKVGRLRLRVSVSSFVPKAHTPFQWAAMDSMESLDRKQRMLLDIRRMKGVDLRTHDIGASWVEGILARGDRRLSAAIEAAFHMGARFDAWSDRCDPEIWRSALNETGLDPGWYLRERESDEVLPWDHLSCGVQKDWLKKEWERGNEGKMTPDCNETTCLKCGVQELFPECKPMRL